MAGACGPRWRPGRAEVHLGVEEDFRPAREADPAVPVPDLEDPAGRLRARGIEVTWDQRLPGYRRFYARDNVGDRPGFLAPRAEKGR